MLKFVCLCVCVFSLVTHSSNHVYRSNHIFPGICTYNMYVCLTTVCSVEMCSGMHCINHVLPYIQLACVCIHVCMYVHVCLLVCVWFIEHGKIDSVKHNAVGKFFVGI